MCLRRVSRYAAQTVIKYLFVPTYTDIVVYGTTRNKALLLTGENRCVHMRDMTHIYVA